MSSNNNSYTTRFATFQAQFDRLRQQITDQMVELERNAENFQAQRENLQAIQSRFRAERLELFHEIVRLQRRLEVYEDDEWYQEYANGIWKNKCIEQKGENNKLLRENIELRHQLYDSKIANEELESRVARLTDELRLLKVSEEGERKTFFSFNTKNNPYAH